MSTRLPIPEGCLNATCIRYGNGKYGGLADIFQSSEHGARPTQDPRPPGGEQPAAQRARPSLRTRSQARRGPRIRYHGRLGERGGAATMIQAMDIDGARRRSHEPTVVRPKLGLGWLESTHRQTGTTCRAASLDGSDWSVERDAGRARLDRVDGGDSRRTGPDRTTI